MPFYPVETFTRDKMPKTAKISYMPTSGRGPSSGKARPDAKPQLSISVPATIAGVAKAKTFVLAVGTGADAGKIRIIGSALGLGVESTELKHAFVFRFGYVPSLGDDKFEGERCPVKKIGDDESEITVPESWFDLPDAKSDEPLKRSAA